MERCKKVMLYYNLFWIFQWILHRLRELSYWVSLCCWHFQRNTAPSRKVLLHLLKYASCYYICLRIQHISKEGFAHSKAFFQGKTCLSTTACIPLNEIVQSSKECPTIFCNMSETLSKEYCIILHPMKDLFCRWDAFKVLQHSILLQSNVTCSQRNTPPFPPRYPKVSVHRYLKNFDWIYQTWNGMRMYVSKIPRFQDLHRTLWVNFGSQKFKKMKNWILRRDLGPPVFQKRTVLLFFSLTDCSFPNESMKRLVFFRKDQLHDG